MPKYWVKRAGDEDDEALGLNLDADDDVSDLIQAAFKVVDMGKCKASEIRVCLPDSSGTVGEEGSSESFLSNRECLGERDCIFVLKRKEPVTSTKASGATAKESQPSAGVQQRGRTTSVSRRSVSAPRPTSATSQRSSRPSTGGAPQATNPQQARRASAGRRLGQAPGLTISTESSVTTKNSSNNSRSTSSGPAQKRSTSAGGERRGSTLTNSSPLRTRPASGFASTTTAAASSADKSPAARKELFPSKPSAVRRSTSTNSRGAPPLAPPSRSTSQSRPSTSGVGAGVGRSTSSTRLKDNTKQQQANAALGGGATLAAQEPPTRRAPLHEKNKSVSLKSLEPCGRFAPKWGTPGVCGTCSCPKLNHSTAASKSGSFTVYAGKKPSSSSSEVNQKSKSHNRSGSPSAGSFNANNKDVGKKPNGGGTISKIINQQQRPKQEHRDPIPRLNFKPIQTSIDDDDSNSGSDDERNNSVS